MSVMAIEKKRLSVEEIEAQTALELPDRETPVTVVIGCLAVCVGQIQIRDVDVDVTAQICAAVDVLNVTLLSLTGARLSCNIR